MFVRSMARYFSAITPPRFIILHVDINDTVIAGDGAKGYSPYHMLTLAASKLIQVYNNNNESDKMITYYNSIANKHKGMQKQDIEAIVLKAIEDGCGDDAGLAKNIRDTVTRYEKGCTSVQLTDGRSVVFLNTFLNLLQTIESAVEIEKCLVLFRTNGPDMGDVLNALRNYGVLETGSAQWHGYGEFEYKMDDWIVNNSNLNKEINARLLSLSRKNEPMFTASVAFDSSADPSSCADFESRILQQSTKRFLFPSLMEHFTDVLKSSENNRKIQFAGLREVFAVWQRYNRYHAKLFYCNPKAKGETAEDAVAWFLDDNAYEEEDKGIPGPYIVTVMHPTSTWGQYAIAPVNGHYLQVLRPEKELAYCDPDHYANLIFADSWPKLKKSLEDSK